MKLFVNLLKFFCIFLLVIIISNSFSEKYKNTYISISNAEKWIGLRFNKLLSNFDKIFSGDKKINLFIGYSSWQFFLDPKVFDYELQQKDIYQTSYNFSFAGIMGQPLYLLLSRLKYEINARDKKVSTIFLDLSPVSLSKKFYVRNRTRFDNLYSETFYNYHLIPNLIRFNPVYFPEIIYNRIFSPISLFNIDSPMVKSLYSSTRHKLPQKSNAKDIWSSNIVQDMDDWNLEDRGAALGYFRRNTNDFNIYLESVHETTNWKNIHSFYQHHHGLNNKFLISEKQFNYFISTIKNALSISDKVIVLIIPYSPSYQKKADQFINYEILIKHIKNETKATVIDLRKKVDFTDKDYVDPMHIRKESFDRLLKIIASESAKYL